jgi:hypothetical protein
VSFNARLETVFANGESVDARPECLCSLEQDTVLPAIQGFSLEQKKPLPETAEAFFRDRGWLEVEAQGRLNDANLAAFACDDAHTRRAG